MRAKQETWANGMGPDSHFAPRELCLGDVAYGSEAGIFGLAEFVRFAPGSVIKATRVMPAMCQEATSFRLFNHLVSEQLDRIRHVA